MVSGAARPISPTHTHLQAHATRGTLVASLLPEKTTRTQPPPCPVSRLNRTDSAEVFARRVAAFNATAWALKERRVTKITSSKDPQSAPAPGVYAAVDFVGRFAGVDRYCGYLMLHQAADGGPFRVMRSVEASVDNATAAAIGRPR